MTSPSRREEKSPATSMSRNAKAAQLRVGCYFCSGERLTTARA
jgi:hypothetical protein